MLRCLDYIRKDHHPMVMGAGGSLHSNLLHQCRVLIPFIARFPEQRLTRAQALKGMTLDAAYASFSEDTLGSLTPGKKADFVVLDRDIMTIPFSEILGTKVSATVIDGEVVYGSL
jgi:adenine deaminase